MAKKRAIRPIRALRAPPRSFLSKISAAVLRAVAAIRSATTHSIERTQAYLWADDGLEKAMFLAAAQLMWINGASILTDGRSSVSVAVMDSFFTTDLIMLLSGIQFVLLVCALFVDLRDYRIYPIAKPFLKCFFIIGSLAIKGAFTDSESFLLGFYFSLYTVFFFRLIRIVDDIAVYESGVTLSYAAIICMNGTFEDAWGYVSAYMLSMYYLKTAAGMLFGFLDGL